MSSRIHIFEDEPALASLVQDYLSRDGFDTEVYHTGTDAVATILGGQPDLVVLDIMLPGKDGLTICREVRAISRVPIILQTARVEEIDRLLGLELGADDYICKPFSPRELVARVKAVLRRSNPPIENAAAPALVMDEATWVAAVNGVSLDLTRREFQILEVMFNRPGRVYSRAQLLDLALPDDTTVIDRTIDSHIKNIRAKVKTVSPDWDPIRSVYGVGYAFEA
jgi:two-component system, OmpR family, response regulator BaeR